MALAALSLLSSWPPPNGTSTILVPPDEVVFGASSALQMAAPASVVWDVLRNTTSYPSWNVFCPTVEILPNANSSRPTTSSSSSSNDTGFLALGDIFNQTCIPNPSERNTTSTTTELVTDISTPSKPSTYVPSSLLQGNSTIYYSDLTRLYRIAWSQRNPGPAQGLKAERFNEIIDLGKDNGCVYRTWVAFGGPLAKELDEMPRQRTNLAQQLGTMSLVLRGKSEDVFANATGRGGNTGSVIPGAPGYVGP